MSETPYQRPRAASSAAARMQLPRVTFAPVAQQINAAFQVLELADAQNLKRGIEPAFGSVLLTDGNGVTWRLTVRTDGSLRTAIVPVPAAPA